MEQNVVSMQELDDLEKAIQKSQELRTMALTKKQTYEETITQTRAGLETLGTTPEKAREEIDFIDKTISDNVTKIKNALPMDLLKEWNMI